MRQASAFSPGNISCVFAICENKSPAAKGSIGFGFTVDKGANVTVRKSQGKRQGTTIHFNNKKINFPTVLSVADRLNIGKIPLGIRISSEVGLGEGFGLSGASALATAYALNRLLGLGKSKIELARVAHIAEVENSTGLGDVVNEYYGGFLVKYVPSSRFVAKKINFGDRKVYYRVFGRLETNKIITNCKMKQKITTAGKESLKRIKAVMDKRINKDQLFSEIIRISKEFAVESSLLRNRKVIGCIREIEKNKGFASMIMLGNAVFSNRKFKSCKTAKIVNKGAYAI